MPFPDSTLPTVSPDPTINHLWAEKIPRQLHCLGLTLVSSAAGWDLIRAINTRKWLPRAFLLSVHVIKRSSVPGILFLYAQPDKPDKVAARLFADKKLRWRGEHARVNVTVALWLTEIDPEWCGGGRSALLSEFPSSLNWFAKHYYSRSGLIIVSNYSLQKSWFSAKQQWGDKGCGDVWYTHSYMSEAAINTLMYSRTLCLALLWR